MKKKLCNRLFFVESSWVRTAILISAFCLFVLLVVTAKAQTVTDADGLYNALTGSSTSIILGDDIYTERFDEYDDPIGFVISEDEGNAIARTIQITSNGKKIRYGKSGNTPYDDGVEFFMEIVQGGSLQFADDADLGGGYGSYAGLFYLNDNATLTFSGNATISNNYSDGYGAIGAETGPNGGNPTISFSKDATFTKNIGSEGGAVSLVKINMGETTTPTMTVVGNAKFDENYASYSGGAAYLMGGGMTINGTLTASGNKSYSIGGAFYLTEDANLIVGTVADDETKESKFTGNIAGYDEDDPNLVTDSGGAIYADTGSSILFNHKVVFGGTTAADANKGDFGGAVYVDDASMTFNGEAVFQNNEATDGMGGALYLTGSEAKINFNKTADFKTNKALGDDGNGGAIYAYYLGDQDIKDNFGLTANGLATFTGNTAGQMGGAIYADGSALQFSSAEFKGNISNYADTDGGGGAIYVTDSLLVFNGYVEMSGNTAMKASGGAVFAEGVGQVDADEPIYGLMFNNGVLVESNTAVNGAGFFLDGSAISFGGTSEIKSNTATGVGGAFAVDGSSQIGFQAGSETTLSGNKAASGGAIKLLDSAELTLKLYGEQGKKTLLTIEAGTSGVSNDVHLGDGSTLYFDTESGTAVAINSVLASTDDSAIINKIGVGDVYLNGNSSGFLGEMIIEEGKVHIGQNGMFGNINSTILNIESGGGIVLTVPDTPTSNAKLSLNELYVDSDSSGQILVKAMSDSTSSTDKHVLIELYDDYEMDPTEYLDQIESYYSFLEITTSSVWDAANNKTLIYGIVKFNDAAPLQFNLQGADDVFTLNASLNKPTENLVVTGLGELYLKGNDNRVAALEGDGRINLNSTTSKITLSGSGEHEFSGNLAGNGSLVIDGDGLTQIFTGNNTYDGGTTVQKGTLQGSTKNLQHNIDVKEAGKIVFDQNQLADGVVGTFSGTLTGNGTVDVINKSAVSAGIDKDGGMRIAGDNSGFDGQINVTKGWLILDSSQAKIDGTTLNLASGAGIGGFGTITNSLLIDNGRGIQAQNGNLNITGMSGSDYALEIKQGGTMYVYADGQSTNVVSVAGNVNLDGATLKVVGVGQNYVKDESFDFLTADYINGSFANSTASYSDGSNTWNFDLNKSGDNKSYSMIGSGDTPDPPGPIPVPTPAGLTWNQTETAWVLDTVDGYSGTPVGFQAMIDDLNLHKTLDADGNPEYDDVYRDITGSQLSGTVRANGLQLGMYSPYRTVFTRLSLGSELYNGAPIIYNNGYGPISGLERTRGGAADEKFLGQIGCVPMDESCAADCSIPCMMGENNFWVDVVHVQTKTKSDGNSDKYGISRTGFLLGMDIQKTPSSRVGMLFGYFAPYLWQRNDRVEADDYHAGLYFQKAHMGAELYGYFGYAHQRYDSRRYVDLSALGTDYGLERYNGKTKGDSFNFSLELSKPRYYGCEYVLRPLIGLDYLYTSQKGYTESGTGTGLYALQYGKAEFDQWFGRVGMTLKKETFQYSAILRLQYINQFGNDPYPDGKAQFAVIGDAPWMNVRGVDLGRDYFNAGFGINLFVNSARSKLLSFDYDANMSRRTTAHGISVIYIERF